MLLLTHVNERRSLWKNTVAMPVVQQNNQKPENCTSFERPLYVPPPAAADPAEPPAKRQAARAGGVTRQPPTPAPGQRQRLWLGTPDLDRLWNQARVRAQASKATSVSSGRSCAVTHV